MATMNRLSVVLFLCVVLASSVIPAEARRLDQSSLQPPCAGNDLAHSSSVFPYGEYNCVCTDRVQFLQAFL